MPKCCVSPLAVCTENRIHRAFDRAGTILASVLRKARFCKEHTYQKFNDRQRAIIERLFEGFEGKLTSSKWAQLTKSSQDTALRDLDDLVTKGALAKDAGGGRSTSYSLIIVEVETDRQAYPT